MHAGGGGGGMHVGGGGRGGAVRVGGGGRGGAVHVGGGGGRFWHGRWYGYGIGPCWSLSPDGYIWVCG